MAKSPAAASIVTERDVRDKLVPVVLGGDIAQEERLHASCAMFWAELAYHNQVRKFKKCVWDTGGRQMGVD
ncbi:MAG: hypothetical protein QM302_06330 [Acidobacteriota bacterium]|nr:hypothetical protein [Acidobacteriota bacterium]